MKPLTIPIIITALALSSFRGCKQKVSPAPAALCCIDFDNSSSFPPGTRYSMHNDSVYYSCGFTVRTDSLYLNGKAYYNFGRIESAVAVFGSGQVINTNNITLKFFNIGTIKPVTISFDYLDRGGRENLSVNGALYSGDISAVPATLGTATVSVTSTAIPLPAKGNKGTVTLTGTIKEFNIGGQEFYLDNICFQ